MERRGSAALGALLCTVAAGLLLLSAQQARPADLAALLPNAKQTFVDANGLPLAGGSVTFYIPATTTPKGTWSDPGEAVPNANPVVLDSAGRAIIYGNGDYREIVKDVFGNTIWDALTQYNIPVGLSVWGGTSSGTANANIVTAAGWTGANGTTLSWVANASNSGATTVTVNGGTPITLVKDAIGGPSALIGNEIISGNVVNALYDGSQLHLLGYPANTGGNLALTGNFTAGGTAAVTGLTTLSGGLSAAGALKFTPPLVVPQGRLTLTTGVPVSIVDKSAVASVFYTPYNGNVVPVYDGTNEVLATFTEQTLSLADASYTGNAVFDVFEFENAGVPTIATGPAWTTAGNFVRTTALTTGTATRATALARVNGLLVNAGGSMAARNGASTYTIANQQGVYLGSVWIDAAGQATTCQVTAGQNRTCGLWNMYNRVSTRLQAFDSTANYTWNTNTWHAANATARNSISILVGWPDDGADVDYQISFNANVSNSGAVGIGAASTSAPSGVTAFVSTSATGSGVAVAAKAHYGQVPFFGTQAYVALEIAASGTITLNRDGAQTSMELNAAWRY